MRVRKLHRLDPQKADLILTTELVVVSVFALVSLVRGEPWAAVISGIFISLFLAWRFWKGAMVGLVIVQVDEDHLMFNDSMFMGKNQFALADVVTIKIVGPSSERRIRVHSKRGKSEEVYRGLRGKRLARIVSFLRENLPANVTLIEDEPPSVMDMFRSNF